jgi:sugar phosphate isomerase/epimerase
MAAASKTSNSSFKVGYQLWGVQKMLIENPDATMQLMVRLGCDGVEFANMLSPFQPAIPLRLAMNKNNLVPCGIHHSLTEWKDKGADYLMEYNYILGNSDVSCHWLEKNQQGSLENYLSHAKFFNELMPYLKKNGFTFYYHNHGYEYQEVFGGKFAMDIMLENTDPALFFMELHIGGLPESVNTVQYIKKLGARLYKMHFPVIGRDGNVSITQDIVDAAMESGTCKWFIIEQGIPDLPTGDSLARSVEILRKMLYK